MKKKEAGPDEQGQPDERDRFVTALFVAAAFEGTILHDFKRFVTLIRRHEQVVVEACHDDDGFVIVERHACLGYDLSVDQMDIALEAEGPYAGVLRCEGRCGVALRRFLYDDAHVLRRTAQSFGHKLVVEGVGVRQAFDEVGHRVGDGEAVMAVGARAPAIS